MGLKYKFQYFEHPDNHHSNGKLFGFNQQQFKMRRMRTLKRTVEPQADIQQQNQVLIEMETRKSEGKGKKFLVALLSINENQPMFQTLHQMKRLGEILSEYRDWKIIIPMEVQKIPPSIRKVMFAHQEKKEDTFTWQYFSFIQAKI